MTTKKRVGKEERAYDFDFLGCEHRVLADVILRRRL